MVPGVDRACIVGACGGGRRGDVVTVKGWTLRVAGVERRRIVSVDVRRPKARMERRRRLRILVGLRTRFVRGSLS